MSLHVIIYIIIIIMSSRRQRVVKKSSEPQLTASTTSTVTNDHVVPIKVHETSTPSVYKKGNKMAELKSEKSKHNKHDNHLNTDLSVSSKTNNKKSIIDTVESETEELSTESASVFLSPVVSSVNVPNELEKEMKFKGALTCLREQIQRQTQSLKELKVSLRKLETSYDHDMSKAVKLRRKRRNGEEKPTGFIKQIPLSKELAELIGEKENVMMAMPEYTSKFFEMMKSNNLLYDGDGRVFRANDKIKKVFSLPDSVNESVSHRDKNGFNLYNLQTHISRLNKLK